MADYFNLKKPNLAKINQEKVVKILFEPRGQNLRDFIDSANEPEYLYWDKIAYKQPIVTGFSREELWFATKVARKFKSIDTIIKNEKGQYFNWVKLPELEKFFHDIDMNTGGELFILKSDFDKATKQKLISRGVMEEAIASSQLEGASTSRRTAKQFLREGRKPKNSSEKMILNNYLTMQAIEEGYKNQKMSSELLFELHGLITKDVLTADGEIPRLRHKGEEIFVVDKASGIIYHKAPKMPFVMQELNRLIKFANDEAGDSFIHPLVKAIMLHFWLGYLHPFTDGNGRVARLLFYWYLLRNGYWAFAYLPISRIIKKSPIQYSMAYMYSEQDDNDLTYFIDYNIRKIKLAVKDFKEYLEKQNQANKEMNRAVKIKYDLNERQIQLLQYLHGDPEERTSLKMHMGIYQVANKTAINDLRGLVSLGFLESQKSGRNVYYYITDKTGELFK